jgi:hypothetical protein
VQANEEALERRTRNRRAGQGSGLSSLGEERMSVPGDNAAYLRQWATDIRKHSGKSVDADRCDAIADEIERLRAEVLDLENRCRGYADRLTRR